MLAVGPFLSVVDQPKNLTGVAVVLSGTVDLQLHPEVPAALTEELRFRLIVIIVDFPGAGVVAMASVALVTVAFHTPFAEKTYPLTQKARFRLVRNRAFFISPKRQCTAEQSFTSFSGKSGMTIYVFLSATICRIRPQGGTTQKVFTLPHRGSTGCVCLLCQKNGDNYVGWSHSS